MQFLAGAFGEAAALFLQLLGQFDHVGCIVTDTLKIGNSLHDHIQLQILRFIFQNLAQADQEPVGTVSEIIKTFLVQIDFLNLILFILDQLRAATGEVLLGDDTHSSNSLGSLVQCNGGRDIQIVSQGMQFGMPQCLFRLILNDCHREFHQQIGKGDQHNSSEQIKGGLEYGDDIAVHGHGPELCAESINRLQDTQNDHKCDSTDAVEDDMNDTGTLGITALTAQEAIECRHEGRTDVDAHNNGIDTREIQRSCNSQGLQHGDSSRRGLNDHSQNQTCEDTQNGLIREAGEQFQECGVISKALDSAGHIHKANKQDTKTNANITDGLGLAALYEHDQNDTDQKSDGCQCIRIEQPQQPIFAAIVHEGQRGDPGSHGGADIGAHDDGHGLFQRQNTSADQRDGKNNGSSGTLNDCCNKSAGQNTKDHITGHFFKNSFQGSAGTVFQTVAHNFDTIEEHSKTAQHLDNSTNNFHTATPIYFSEYP